MRFITYRLARNMEKMVDFYSQFNPSSLSIKQFIDFGLKADEQKSYQFLKKELPVRLANIMKEIHLLPDNLLKMPSVGLVNNWYTKSFNEIIEFEVDNECTEQTLNQFCKILIHIRNRHSDVVETMAQGVLELKDSYEIDVHTENSIQYFLDRFYMSRIGIRMLINHHTLLFCKNDRNHNEHNIGCFNPYCDVVSVVKDAYENARFLCEQYYLTSPELEICNNIDSKGESIKIVYVPSHLYHILFELFKNSMRSMVEVHHTDTLPPLLVTIVKGKEDVCIKVSDQGAGIPRSLSEKLFQYMYSTAPQPSKSDVHTVPLAGYGYGLPISRLYARYFHGDLVLMSCDGYGTDAIIYLKALNNEANELLPIYNKMSTKFYKTEQTIDWRNGCNHLRNHKSTETQ